jgi:antitoxin HicB
MPMSYSFSVILEPQPDGGYTVLVPALPEVVTEGDTEQQALSRLRKRSAPFWTIGKLMA